MSKHFFMFLLFCAACKQYGNLTICNKSKFVFVFFLVFCFVTKKVKMHDCVVYLLRSEYSCCFLSKQFGFGGKTIDVGLLFSCFNCTICELHTALLSYLFLKRKRHFSIKLLKMFVLAFSIIYSIFYVPEWWTKPLFAQYVGYGAKALLGTLSQWLLSDLNSCRWVHLVTSDKKQIFHTSLWVMCFEFLTCIYFDS